MDDHDGRAAEHAPRRVGRRRGDRDAARRDAEQDAPPEEPLSEEERAKLGDRSGLSALTIYAVVRHEGEEELRRPVHSLWWSGVAAGVGISSSVLAEALLRTAFAGHPYREALENFGYSVGFVLVILSRLQLFTENTITVILPLLSGFTKRRLWRGARLWAVVFAANLVGTFTTAAMSVYLGTVHPEHVAKMLELSREFAENTPLEALVYGVPAGFFIAAIVWMLPSARGSEIVVIVLLTYLIALGEFTHVIAGSCEAFLLLLEGEIGVVEAFGGLILPSFVGNILGGTGLFALLAYAQVSEEM